LYGGFASVTKPTLPSISWLTVVIVIPWFPRFALGFGLFANACKLGRIQKR